MESGDVYMFDIPGEKVLKGLSLDGVNFENPVPPTAREMCAREMANPMVNHECDEFEMDVLINKMKIIQGSNRGFSLSVKIDVNPPIHSKQGELLDEFLQWCMNRNIIPDFDINHNGTGFIFIKVDTIKPDTKEVNYFGID